MLPESVLVLEAMLDHNQKFDLIRMHGERNGKGHRNRKGHTLQQRRYGHLYAMTAQCLQNSRKPPQRNYENQLP